MKIISMITFCSIVFRSYLMTPSYLVFSAFPYVNLCCESPIFYIFSKTNNCIFFIMLF
ncbi:unnamed protein product [Brassica oleracea]